jgi:hypothetical protein
MPMSKGSRINSTLAPERYSATELLVRFSSAPKISPLHFAVEWALVLFTEMSKSRPPRAARQKRRAGTCWHEFFLLGTHVQAGRSGWVALNPRRIDPRPFGRLWDALPCAWRARLCNFREAGDPPERSALPPHSQAPMTFSAAARESLGNLRAAALVWPERRPGDACGCRPGQGGEDRVTLLAFRSRPGEAGHISDRTRCCCRLARGEPACASD